MSIPAAKIKNEGLVFTELPTGQLEFVGNFEALYNTDPDPWNQSGHTGDEALRKYYQSSRAVLISAVRDIMHSIQPLEHRWGMEIGCGHGHVTQLLHGTAGGTWVGIDISQEAIRVAQDNIVQEPFKLGGLMFDQGDITKVSFPKDISTRFGVIVLGQVLWYIMHDLNVVMCNVTELLHKGGCLVISQAFLQGEQRYGRDYVDGFSGLLKRLLEYDQFKVVETRYSERVQPPFNDGLIVLKRVL